MFLNNLEQKQKLLFMELAIKAAEANGVVELEEKNMLKCFSIEMNIQSVYHTDRDLEDILNEIIQISTERELRIILFEILGIIISDGVFDEYEKEFIKHVVERCNMNVDLVDKMTGLLFDYTKLYQNIVKVVL